MARSSIALIVDTRTSVVTKEGSTSTGQITKVGRPLLRKVIRHLEGLLGGVTDGSHILIQTDGAQPVAANATITIASGSNAADTVTINGTAITAVNGTPVNNQYDMSGNATAECTSLAAAINASTTALISKHCEASNWAGSVALSSCPAGTVITIAGYQFVAKSGTISLGVGHEGDFDISGNDSADGDALVAAINAHPVLSHKVFASNSAGTVTIRQKRGTSALGIITCVPLGSQTVTQFAATNVVLVSAIAEDQTGNAITLAESTGGVRIAVSGARLTGGTGAASGTLFRYVVGSASN